MDKSIAYSLLTVKEVSDEQRVIRGMATTPEPDRVGDIVEPLGVTHKGHIPLLWQHDHLLPVGTVTFGKPTEKGVPFEAKLPVVSEPSQLKARIDEAWSSVKAGIIRAVSIGFRPLEYSVIEETGGLRFTKTDVFELSLVSVPAQPNATITQIKSLDRELRAALGDHKDEVKDLKTPSGVTEKKSIKPVKLTSKEDNKMTIAEQIKQFQDTLVSKNAKIEELAKASAESGETFDEAQKEEFDTLSAEVKEVEDHIKRLEVAQKAAMAKAVPVTEKAGQSEKGASEVRSPVAYAKAKKKLEPGIEFTQYVMCQAKAKGDTQKALNMAKNYYGDSESVVKALEFENSNGGFESVMKSAVAAGTTLHSTWAAPLVDYQRFTGDFIEFLRPQTIIGQFGQNGVPALRQIPFNVRIPAQTTGGAAYWVGEGKPKPVTKFDFDDVEHRWAKLATISVLTEELIRFSDPSAETLVRDGLARAIIQEADLAFIDPTNNGAANVKPASILYYASNAPTVASSGGTDAEAVRCDIQALWSFFTAAHNPARSAVYIMDSTVARALSLMQNPLGQSEFAGLTVNGGTFLGTPVIVSDNVPTGVVALVNASDIYFSDDGQVTIDASREASIQMLDDGVSGDGAPTNDSSVPTPTTVVSMFQTNSVAIRAERYINWSRRRASAVAYLTGVNWGACAS